MTAIEASLKDKMRYRFPVIAGFVLIACLIYCVSPFLSIARLSQAIRTRDGATITQQVDFDRLRRSVAGQITSAYLRVRGRDLNPLLRNLAAGIAGGVAERYLSEILTPEAVMSLLSGDAQKLDAGTTLKLPSLGRVFDENFGRVLHDSVFSNPITYVLWLPDGFGVDFRFAGTSWKVAGVELPADLAETFAREIIRREKLTN